MFSNIKQNGERLHAHDAGRERLAASIAGMCIVVLIGALLWMCAAPDSRAGEEPPPAPAGTSEERTVKTEAGWGTLVGRFVFEGPPPKRVAVATCEAHSDPRETHEVFDESLVVDPATRGIKNIVVYARKVSRVHDSHRAQSDSAVTMEQKHCRFVPRVLPMQVHQPLSIRNGDPIMHVFVLRPRYSRDVNVLLFPGDECSEHFSHWESRPVAVSCTLHPWEKAYLIVRKDAYVAVTDEYGYFDIPNLPAGKAIEFQIWHEKAAGPNGALIAKPEWTKGRFRVTIPSDGVKRLGTVKVVPSAFQTKEGRATHGEKSAG